MLVTAGVFTPVGTAKEDQAGGIVFRFKDANDCDA